MRLARLDARERKRLADERLKSVGARTAFGGGEASDGGELRQGDEAAQADVDDEASAIRFDDLGLDDLTARLELGHPGPLSSAACSAHRKDDTAVRSLGLDHRGHDSVADCDIRSF